MRFKPKLSPLLPALALVCLISFSIRGLEVWTGFKDVSGSAFAEVTKPADAEPPAFPEKAAEEEAAAKEPAEKDEKAAAADKKPADKDAAKTDKAEKTDETEEDWTAAEDEPFAFSPLRGELAQDIAKRRKEVEAKESDLLQREALLEAAEKELDRKYGELTALRLDIEQLLDKQSEEENARIASLVKIYEGMKAKDAANIFNTLDLDVLVEVMSRMSERKASPVLAAMDPERARTVTIVLAEQKKLPALPTE